MSNKPSHDSFTHLTDFPLDINNLMKKKMSIRKELLQGSAEYPLKKIAIMGGSTTAEIKDMIEIFMLRSGVKPLFYESQFNAYYEESYFENPTLEAFKPDIIYFCTTNVNINEYPSVKDTEAEVQAKLDAQINRLTDLWDRVYKKYNCTIFQNNFELPYHRELGNLDSVSLNGRVNYILRLNAALANFKREHSYFHILDICYLSSYIGLKEWFDNAFWYAYKYAVSFTAIPYLAYYFVKVALSLYGQSKKCIVLDLDNTLWGGTIADDGIEKIQLGEETPVGEAYRDFQKYLKSLKERGIMLAVCSKNDLNLAEEGFQHPDSILKRDDFLSFKANWEPKNENIVKIAQELNIDLSSIVFIDDNPAERQLIRSQLPDVLVVEIGSDVGQFKNILDKGGWFEIPALSAEDLNRNKFYEDNQKRTAQAAEFKDYGDYLNSLEMQAEVGSFNDFYMERISLLINKTNQFNLTTRRYSQTEVEAMAHRADSLTLYGRLKDKFGDNGLVTVVIANVKNNECHIDTWLMSCRVLKRTMEIVILDFLIEACRERGVKKIFGYYYPTAKNGLVANHYADMGFTFARKDLEGSIWQYEIPNNYQKKNKHIKLVESIDVSKAGIGERS